MKTNNSNEPLYKLSISEYLELHYQWLIPILEGLIDQKQKNGNKQVNTEDDTTLDVGGAAQLLKISRQTIYQNIKAIPHRKIFGRLVFLRKELLRFIDENGNPEIRNKGDP